MTVRATALLVACLLVLPAAASDFESCKGIKDAERRLACFDALDAKDEPFPVHTRITGPFRSWNRGTRFKLENKQVWVATDDKGYYPGVPDNPKVTITETSLGAFWLEVAGTNGRKIKVKRIK